MNQRWSIRYPRYYSKYGNKRTKHKGIMFDSKKEGRHSDTLDLLISAGEIVSYQGQVPFELFAKNGTKVCIHKVDFLLDYPDGHQEVNEVKSYATMTDTWKLKHKLFMDNYPEIPYIVIV